MRLSGSVLDANQHDVFLLTASRSHILASDPESLRTVTPVDLSDILSERTGSMAHCGNGDDFFMIGGKVELGADCGQLLLDVLPSLIHVRAGSRQTPTLRWLLNQLVREREEDQPGTAVASAQLAHLMFIEILRGYFETAGQLAAGWLRAVSDKRLAPALRLMHGDPARSWQLEELAKAASMSRGSFASYFKSAAGIAPVAYLTEWRMRLAERSLRENTTPVGVLALSLGYSSESAFSNAFKRVVGRSPKHYRSGLKRTARAENMPGNLPSF